jgi:hypothetical protein
MPIFIDESGDTGLEETSSRFFRLAAIWIAKEQAEPFRNAIDQLRNDFGLKHTHEFKYAWSGNHPEHREAIVKLAIQYDFRFAVCSIDKMKEPWLSGHGSDILDVCVESVLRSLRPVFVPFESLTIDNNDDHDFLALVKRHLRGYSQSTGAKRNVVKKVRFANSKSDSLLQLADLICGLTADEFAEPALIGMIQNYCLGRDGQ